MDAWVGGLPATRHADALDTGAMPWPRAAANPNAKTATTAMTASWAALTILNPCPAHQHQHSSLMY